MKREKTQVPSRKRQILPLNFLTAIKLTNRDPTKRKFSRADISVGLTYAYYQARLLRTLIGLDRRFYDVAMVLKYWAKQNGFINQDLHKQSYSFSSYAFTQMVVFYLQNTKPPVLPKVVDLQNKFKDGKKVSAFCF